MGLFEVVCRWQSGCISCNRWVVKANTGDEAKEIAQADEGETGYSGEWHVFPITPDANPAIVFSMAEYS